MRISKKKTLLIAPTTGLVDQQVKMAREFVAIDPSLIVTYTGDSKPELRSDIWKEGAIIIATPQVIRNDHYASRIDVKEIGTLILDEVHHCKGNHAYGQVADIFVNESPETRILGASASPGTKKNEIDSIMIRLGMTKLTYFEKDDERYLCKLILKILYLPKSLITSSNYGALRMFSCPSRTELLIYGR